MTSPPSQPSAPFPVQPRPRNWRENALDHQPGGGSVKIRIVAQGTGGMKDAIEKVLSSQR